MSYSIVEVDLSHSFTGIESLPKQTGAGVIFRSGSRPLGFAMVPLASCEGIDRDALLKLAGPDVAERLIALSLEQARKPDDRTVPVLPSLSVVICTKDRAVRLSRLLTSLVDVVAASPFASAEIVVVDNASVDDATKRVCERLERVRYVFEPRAGLNFARNAALGAATGTLIAYLDDDVVVDRGWLEGLARAWRSLPDAGGFTGLVLPFRLDSVAQIAFEERGGFGRGFKRKEFRSDSFNNALHPVGAGSLGAGCNMAFDRLLLLRLGGFDEALDTGAPLPGGGDLDIFYRVLRAGRTMVYEPSYLVFHEHRETMAQLERQYWSWGLGFMAFLVKARRSDPDLRARQSAMVRWWFVDQSIRLAASLRHGRWQDARFAGAELWGGVMGFCGEYDRSRRRTDAIKAPYA